MLASIWLQPSGPQKAALVELIEMLAEAHDTVRFQPHLTVCSPQLNPDSWAAAAQYIRDSRRLPLTVRKERISYSTTAPMRAVVIEVEASSLLQSFRDDLRRITGAAEPAPPHISLLYSVEGTGRQPKWSSDESTLKAIAEECAKRIEMSEFALDRPVVVAPDGDWSNVRSWRIVRVL
jgi:Cyclic phosphodiesterase-like protein